MKQFYIQHKKMFCCMSLKLAFFMLACFICCVPVYGQGKCDAPGSVDKAIPASGGSSFLIGFKMSYSCLQGYRLNTSNNIRTCQPDLTWSAAAFQCVRQSCSVPDSPQHGGFNGDEYVFGKSVTYFCNIGYQIVVHLNQRNKASCIIDTSSTANSVKWSRPAPVCNIVACPPPAVIPNGSFNDQGLSHTYNTRIEYTCQAGYVASESSPIYRTCNENGTWGDPPVCSVDYGCDFQNPRNQFCGYTNTGWQRVLSTDFEGTRGFVLSGSPSSGATISLTSRSADIPPGGSCLSFYYKITSVSASGKFWVDLLENSASQVIWERTTVQQVWDLASVVISASSNQKQWVFKATGPVEVYLDLIKLSSCQVVTTAATAVTPATTAGANQGETTKKINRGGATPTYVPESGSETTRAIVVVGPSLMTVHYVLIALAVVLVVATIGVCIYCWCKSKNASRGTRLSNKSSPPL